MTEKKLPAGTIEPGLKGYSRHDSPETSVEAGELHDASKLMNEIYEVMAKYGDAGCIGDEVVRDMPHRSIQAISPRFKQMREHGMIELTGETRTGLHYNRQQQVRRVLKPPFIKLTAQEKARLYEDPRITRARRQVELLRETTTLMCSADRVRINFHLNTLESILQ